MVFWVFKVVCSGLCTDLDFKRVVSCAPVSRPRPETKVRLLVGEKTAPTVRSRAATAMSYMGAAGAPYAPVMHSLLEDADAGLRSAACRALGMMGE